MFHYFYKITNNLDGKFYFGVHNTENLGDDENDYESMLLCQYKACPKNATSKIKNIANFISNYDGGLGAVREYCEYILASNIKN